jgi:hypothetical protein
MALFWTLVNRLGSMDGPLLYPVFLTDHLFIPENMFRPPVYKLDWVVYDC